MNDGDALSPQEVQALLAAVHSGGVPVSPGQQATERQPVAYDFRRPRRVSKDQIRALTNVHKEFTKLLGASLSGMLRTMVDLEVETIEQITYSEYTLALPITTCAFLFNLAPLKGPAVIELAPRAAFVAIDRLLGGQGQGATVSRDLTEIERVVIERVGARMVTDLAAAWHGVGKFTPGDLHIETNSQLIQATAPTEVIVVVTLATTIGDAEARMTVGYPYPSLEPVLALLGSQRWASLSPRERGPGARAFLETELAESRLDIRARLGHARLTVRDVLNLRPGQLIGLNATPEHPVRVDVNGVPKFVGRPGTHRQRLAVELLGRANERSVDP